MVLRLFYNECKNSFKSKPSLFLVFVLCFIFVSIGCDNKDNNKQISQGIIQFDISYNNRSDKKFPVQLMPKTMELKFNKDFSSYTIEDRLGLFSIKNILSYNNRNHITLIKFFDKKYVYSGTLKEPPLLFNSSVDYKVTYFDDTSRLAGFLCRKAVVTDKLTNSDFDIFYTSNIIISKPNINTPYKAIDGMLLGFRLNIKTLDMQLKAKKFEHKIVKNDQFEIPKDYKPITRKQMEEIITTILP